MRIWRYALGLLLAIRADAAQPAKVGPGFVTRTVAVEGTDYRYQVYLPPRWSSDSRWPVILFLHGGGGYGSDGIQQTTEGLGPAIRRHPERFPAIVVFPQAPANGTPGWQQIGGRIAIAALEQSIREFSGDSASVVLTGLSIGGNGAWHLAYHDPKRFTRLLVICGFASARKGAMHPILYPSLVPGTGDPFTPIAKTLASLPIWVVHGDSDRTVSVQESRRMTQALRTAGASVNYTELRGVDHNAWDVTYERPDVAEWLTARGAPPPPR